MLFADRRDAGRRLADPLLPLASAHPVVVALPRGGVPVAFEIARALRAPLDVLAVRKLGAPDAPELAIGAIAEDGSAVLLPDVARATGASAPYTQAVIERETAELARRTRAYRGGRPPLPLQGRTVIVVDDGVATGATDVAAVRALRNRGAERVIVAVPVGAPESLRTLAEHADDVVALATPHDFGAVGRWYRDFHPVSDAEVRALLHQAAACADGDDRVEPVIVEADGIVLAGDLGVPPDPAGVVVFAHGSGSSRLSPRNQAVARRLEREQLATLLVDLLTEREARDRAAVFDIGLLTTRLLHAVGWLREDARLGRLPLGLFGASTGAAAALGAAARLGDDVAAVVSRGGRPDLAGEHLPLVRAPTLLIVGGEDHQVLELNRRAAARLRAPHELIVVPGAGHLFEEPGALEAVASLAAQWFARHLVAAPARAGTAS